MIDFAVRSQAVQEAVRPPEADRPALSWESELFVVQGEDRERLVGRIHALLAFLDREPGVGLKDLAATLAGELLPNTVRLTVVAGSVADLQTRLRRAAERLADDRTRFIKDSVGIYYFSEPLYQQGGLALLFPGEGAQYLNMLADLLPHFPEVQEVFSKADSESFPITSTFLVPASATPEEKTEIEKRLRSLEYSISSVLLADMALFRIMQELQVPISVMAGHSAGELMALTAAGCQDSTQLTIDCVLRTMSGLEKPDVPEGASPTQSPPASGALLLAVGAGRALLMPLLQELGVAAEVFLAMDNCPHQSVVVGLPEPMRRVEAALQARGTMCERLPFHRPYHTPLFEPFMEPLRRMFDPVVFGTPQVPVYCCTTGRRFPDDGEAIRSLALGHWVAPVEFTQMVQNLHADGVRIFVETGPRGNLTAFVEDILRGQHIAALAVNVSRRSGLTQINHTVGQLVAHQVPVRLNYLFERRQPRTIYWQGEPAPVRQPPSGPRGAVLVHYLGVMDEFLQVQQTVMEQFLARRHPTATPPVALQPVAETAVPEPPERPPEQPAFAAGSPAPWIMLGTIRHYEPGCELVTHRYLHLEEDLYVRDHSLGGNEVSRVDPQQHGSPVLPMTFSLEIVAEAAAVLLPHLKVIAIENVRLHRWIAFEEGVPTILEIRARLLPAGENDDTLTVSATIADCGHDLPEGPGGRPPRLVVEANVVLAEAYPEAPSGQIAFTNDRPATVTLEQLYRSLFHGPLFRGVVSADRLGDREIEGTVRVPERGEWFASTPEPALLYDPVLLDICMHVLAAWHLEQPDQSGRVLLPFKLDRIEFFGPSPAPNTRLKVRASTELETARNVRHSFEVFTPDGRILHRMKGAWYWRFYLPIQDKINFNSPKDEYFLSALWPEAVPSGADACCMFLELPPDLNQALMVAALARVISTPGELEQYSQQGGSTMERLQWLCARLAPKDAVRQHCFDKHGERLMPADMVLRLEESGRATLSHRAPDRKDALPAARLAWVNGKIAALATYQGGPGIALAVLPPTEQPLCLDGLDAEEQRLLHSFKGDSREMLTRFLCARKALVQALAPELPGAEIGVAVRGIADSGLLLLAVGPALAEAFPEYRLDLLQVQTTRRDQLVAATTLCQRAEQ